ncbi:MAG: hypothetical protein ACQ5SW_05215 [Sphaerochaetaceae bacterium]
MQESILSLTHPTYLQINDGKRGVYYGADQEWYSQSWQRRAGCGPTTASNLVLYNLGKEKGTPAAGNKGQVIELMQQIWEYVTPTLMGVHLVSQFTNGLTASLPTYTITGHVAGLSLPKARNIRPPFTSVIDFIKESLMQDQPVAFLNLHHGAVQNLDSWHWVTIVALDAEQGMVQVYDGGKQWMINLALWYETTPRAGGFAVIQR